MVRPPLYYRLAIKAVRPLYRLLLAYKKAKLPHYEREINERFARHYLPIKPPLKGVIWCHAVSLGELNTAYPLLKRLLDDGYGLWITSTTQTGFGRAGELFCERLGQEVQHSFVPVDDVAVLKRFLAHVRPVLAMFIETELWANTLYLLAKQGIPSVMANARLTQKSFQRYHKFACLTHSLMSNLTTIIAQDAQSYDNFIALGASYDKVVQSYSLKWSYQPSKRPNSGIYRPAKPIWVMASTHTGEDELALSVHRQILAGMDALLIIVPRHPERFDEVYLLCRDFVCHRRSDDSPITDSTQVYLADSMGELALWYELCDVAVVGGSFVDKGGHNPIEPASLAKPVIMGQYVKNCAQIVHDLSQVGALVQTDGDGLYEVVNDFLQHPDVAKQSGRQGKALVGERSGADRRQFCVIKALL